MNGVTTGTEKDGKMTELIQISERIYGKAEFTNPTGSIKDRPARYIIENAESNGLLKKGDTVIEATSGNMGISIASLCAEKGLYCKIIMPANMSDERKKIIQYLGAELILVDDGDFDGAIEMRDILTKEKGYFNFNQFHNQLNIECHHNTTASEIYTQSYQKNIKIGAIVSGTGTGGTIMGCQKFFSKHLKDVKIVAVEPSESPVMSGGEPGLHGIQGIGDGSKFLVELDKVDEIILVSTEEAKERAKKLHKENGLIVGISAGANILAAEKWVEQNPSSGSAVTFLCDSGFRYLSCL